MANNEGEREEGRIEGGRGETKEEGRFLRSTELFSSWLLSLSRTRSVLRHVPWDGMGAPSNGFSSCVGRGNVADMKANGK